MSAPTTESRVETATVVRPHQREPWVYICCSRYIDVRSISFHSWNRSFSLSRILPITGSMEKSISVGPENQQLRLRSATLSLTSTISEKYLLRIAFRLIRFWVCFVFVFMNRFVSTIGRYSGWAGPSAGDELGTQRGFLRANSHKSTHSRSESPGSSESRSIDPVCRVIE